jgi:hypothetical protein
MTDDDYEGQIIDISGISEEIALQDSDYDPKKDVSRVAR